MSIVIVDEFSKASLADRLVGAFGRGDGVGAIGWAAGLSLSQNRIGARALICGALNAVTQPALVVFPEMRCDRI